MAEDSSTPGPLGVTPIFRVTPSAVPTTGSETATTPSPEAEPSPSPTSPPHEPTPDPGGVVPGTPFGYQTATRSGPEWHQFFSAVHPSGVTMKDMDILEEFAWGRDRKGGAVEHLYEEAKRGNFESAVASDAEALKRWLEHGGATPRRTKAILTAALTWIETSPEAIFGHRASTEPSAEEVASMQDIYRRLSTMSKDTPEFGRLNAQALAWQAKHPKRGYG